MNDDYNDFESRRLAHIIKLLIIAGGIASGILLIQKEMNMQDAEREEAACSTFEQRVQASRIPTENCR